MPDYSKLTNCARCGKLFKDVTIAHILSETVFFCEDCEIPEEELTKLGIIHELIKKKSNKQ